MNPFEAREISCWEYRVLWILCRNFFQNMVATVSSTKHGSKGGKVILSVHQTFQEPLLFDAHTGMSPECLLRASATQQQHVEASADAGQLSGRHGLRRTRVENAKEKKRLMDFGGVCVSGASQSAAEPRKIFQLTSMYQPTTNICLRPLLPERER